jgi:hypothetical protein
MFPSRLRIITFAACSLFFAVPAFAQADTITVAPRTSIEALLSLGPPVVEAPKAPAAVEAPQAHPAPVAVEARVASPDLAWASAMRAFAARLTDTHVLPGAPRPERRPPAGDRQRRGASRASASVDPGGYQAPHEPPEPPPLAAESRCRDQVSWGVRFCQHRTTHHRSRTWHGGGGGRGAASHSSTRPSSSSRRRSARRVAVA